jgi:hypothetical protein
MRSRRSAPELTRLVERPTHREARGCGGAAGITRVGFVEYVVASWAGMLPGTFAYVYLGGGARSTLDAVGSADADGFPVAKIVLYAVRACVAAPLPSLMRGRSHLAARLTFLPEKPRLSRELLWMRRGSRRVG